MTKQWEIVITTKPRPIALLKLLAGCIVGGFLGYLIAYFQVWLTGP